MSKYIKKFENNAEYEQYAASAEYVEPHVSLSVEENEVHYNKPPKPEIKWTATYQDGHTASALCDGTGVITSSEISDKHNLRSAVIGDCVTELGTDSFMGSLIENINIGKNVTTLGLRCLILTRLTSVDIPSGVTFIGQAAFAECSVLTSITLHPVTPPTIGNADVFANTPLQTIFVPAESVDAYKNADIWRNYASKIQPIA